ncbi:DNA polymerase III subunit alpha, partial [Acinetobacter baumannii]|nr:DNA polymerase III subunit alpha [Acinetobacter baumannii]
RGETVGVFQLESSGMQQLLKNISNGGAVTFDDICAVTALYRPGPMDSGMLDDYVDLRKGLKEVTYAHEVLEPVLSDTYGVVVYQEQTMALARKLAGFSMAESDHLRKAIGKKDLKKMAELKPKFIDGAKAGFVEVELEDGTKLKVHRMEKFKCTDGVMRTVEEAFAESAEIQYFYS